VISSEFLICFFVPHSRHIFFITRIIDPISGDVMNIVPRSTRQYATNTYKLNHDITWLESVVHWLISHTHKHTHTHTYNIYKGISLHKVTTYSHFHLSYGILVRKYNNVMNTLQKEQEHPLKSVFIFKLGIISLSTCLPVGIDMVPPSARLL
jgi:hypothetical protein